MTALSPLYAIMVACLAGGVLAILAAAGTLALHARWLGGLAGYAALASMQHMLPTVLASASASLLYVAVAGLIPSLHRHPAPAATAQQLLLIGTGIALIAGVHLWLEH